MEAGALGAEIVIRGKLRTERARYEKFKQGYLPKSGEPALRTLREAVLHVQLKPGMYGIRVRIMPPDATFPDQVKLIEPSQEEPTKAAEKPEPTKEPEQPAEPQEVKETEAEAEAPPGEPEPAITEEQPKEKEQ
jgi:small subunit ribosomal protein S3